MCPSEVPLPLALASAFPFSRRHSKIASRRSTKMVGNPTWWSACMCEIHTSRSLRSRVLAPARPYKRQS